MRSVYARLLLFSTALIGACGGEQPPPPAVTLPVSYLLTVSRAGSGEGVVTSDPAGINCGADCSESYSEQTSVTLTAEPAGGSDVAWTGCTQTDGGECMVLMQAPQIVTATFTRQDTAALLPLTVNRDGYGTGSVTGTDIDCGEDCTASHPADTTAVLTATPAAGSVFGEWTGCDEVVGTRCRITMAAARTVKATFGFEPSDPKYDVLSELKQYVVMADGTRIQADVHRPNGATGQKFPAIVWFDVYWKEDTNAVVNKERDFFVTRGYAFVHASSPGSNSSGGEYNVFDRVEQDAAAAVVEWSGVQPWSTGKVGMNGLSYSAIIQYFVGHRNPPHLVTLYPASAYSDLYRDIVYVGGNLQAGYPILWDVNNRTPAYLPPAEPGSDPATTYTNYTQSVAAWKPILSQFAVEKYDGPFYRERSPRWENPRIEVPFALDVGWYDDMLYGGPLNFETLSSSFKRLVIGPWGHSETHRRVNSGPDPTLTGRQERLRWYDFHLKGLETGVTTDPKVRIFVPEAKRKNPDGTFVGHWRAEAEWPISRTQYRELFLGPGNTLVSVAPPSSGSASYRYIPDRTQQYEGVNFVSEPLGEDIEVTGYAELVLYASVGAGQLDTSFTVTVEDVDASNTRVVLQSGWLRAAAREVDPLLSMPGRPYHKFAGELPVNTSEIVEYRVAIWPICNLFKAGHRIRVSITDQASGPGGLPFFSPPYEGTNTVHFGGNTPSRLVLPVIPPPP